MNRERRIRKQSRLLNFSRLDDDTKKQLLKKKNNYIKGSFQTIPLPAKISYLNKIYSLYGNIVLMEQNGSLIIEPSLINNIVNYRDIQVSKLSNQKIVTIFAEKIHETLPSELLFLVNKLKSCKDIEAREWAKTIQAFCENYEQIITNNTEKENISQDNQNKDVVSSVKSIQSKKMDLMENYPSICFTSHYKSQQNSLEISVNQKFLTEIGYSTDSFSSVVLQEGIPQLISLKNDNLSAMTKVLLENYFTNDEGGFQTSEFEVPLLLKSGYVKNVQLKIHLLVNRQNFGITFDTIFTIISKKTPFFQEKSFEDCLNLDFLNLMTFKEREMEFFLSSFYKESPALRYTNMNKFCRVQEINESDDDDN